MNFIGRKTELATLEKEYDRSGGFVVLYGRRRVGKTTLIKEFLKNKTGFYFLATREVETQSRRRLAGVISRATGNSYIANAEFHDWDTLFRLIADYQPGEKKILVIDEFPYLVKTNPAFPSVIQNVWDEFLKSSNVMLILCGSLLGMMKKHTLDYDSPLYGRRTAQIRLMPLSFTDVYNAQSLDFESAVLQYAVTGGVPKYMEFFDDCRNLSLQIEENILSRNGFLYEEPGFLLDGEVQVPTNYFSIIKSIADGNHKLGNIAKSMELGNSAIIPYITTLIELGFVEKQVPITEDHPEKSRKGLYFLSDNFIRFWFRYVYPFKGELELENRQIVLEELKKDFVKYFAAFAYEDICKDIFTAHCRSGKLPFVPSRIGSYWLNDRTGDTQIDIMAVDHTNKAVFAGECKFHIRPIDVDVYFDLRKKVEFSSELQKAFPEYRFVYGVFSKSGFTDRMLAEGNRKKDTLFLFNQMEIVK